MPEIQVTERERSEMAWRGLANVYEIATGNKCAPELALGMATSAVSTLRLDLKATQERHDRTIDALNAQIKRANETEDRIEELTRERDAWIESRLSVAREALSVLASRQCGSFCTEKDADGNERYKDWAKRCAVCISKRTLAALGEPEAQPHTHSLHPDDYGIAPKEKA